MRVSAILTTGLALAMTAGAQSDYTEALSGLSGNSKTLDMVYVKGGTYTRGCSTGDSHCEAQEKPAHTVTVSDYYIGKYELTNAQWQAVVGDNTAKDNKPKTGITWYDAVEFTCKISQKTGKAFRLLTDAEFEFAARGGIKTQGYLYSGSNSADGVAWHAGNVAETCFGAGAVMTNRLRNPGFPPAKYGPSKVKMVPLACA